MIFTLGSIALIILAFIFYRISRHCYYNVEDFFDGASFLCGLVGGAGILVCVLAITLAHVGVNCRIEENQIAYENLCDRLEVINSDYEDVSKSDVIKDIGEWNSKVHSTKYWSENPWTSWFHSQREADALQYIEINK